MLASGTMATSLVVLGVMLDNDTSNDDPEIFHEIERDVMREKRDAPLLEDDEKMVDIKANLTNLIAPIAVVLYSFAYGFGFGSVVYTWSSELFPPKAKSIGCSLCLSVRFVVVFTVLKFYPYMLSTLGLSKLFWIHSAITFLGVGFVFLVVPETRGLSLTQMAELFGGKVHLESNSSRDSFDGSLITAGTTVDDTDQSTADDLTSLEEEEVKEEKEKLMEEPVKETENIEEVV